MIYSNNLIRPMTAVYKNFMRPNRLYKNDYFHKGAVC